MPQTMVRFLHEALDFEVLLNTNTYSLNLMARSGKRALDRIIFWPFHQHPTLHGAPPLKL